MLSSPLEAIEALAEIIASGEAAIHIAATAQHMAGGMLAAVTIGILAAALCVAIPSLWLLLQGPVDAARNLSPLVLYPVFLLLFGLSTTTKIAIVFWIAYPAVLLSALSGMSHVDRSVVEAARMDGAGRRDVIIKISAPLAVPSILTGIRIAAGAAWTAMIAAEILGSNAGMGYYVLDMSQSFRFPEMYAGILMIAGLGLAINWALYGAQFVIERRLQI